MPILYFGDYSAYRASPVRFLTVGLNPSLNEFPEADPWSRFRAAEPLNGQTSLGANQHDLYLAALDGYFTGDPYRAWFNGSFEPLLQGADASYYPGSGSTALHTDIASPVATSPTWSRLGRRRSQHQGGPELWRDLVKELAPDVLVVSVAREHLEALKHLQVRQWTELMRIERESPFVVSETQITLDSRPVLVVFGRCTNVPFGSVRFADRERIGQRIRARLEELRAEEAEA